MAITKSKPTTTTTKTTRPLKKNMSFVSHSARTCTVNNNDNHIHSFNTTEANDKHNNDDDTNSPAGTTSMVVLRLARSDS